MPLPITASRSAPAAILPAFVIAFAAFVPLLFAATPRAVHAQTIAQYTFTFASLASTNTAANVTAGDVDFTDSSSILISTTTSFLTIYVIPGMATSANGAVAANTYFQFQMTPSTGFALNLTSLTFDAARGQGATTGYVVRSSVDNYAANLGTDSVPSNVVSNFFTPLNLSSLQSLTAPINFRIYTYGTDSAGGVVPAIRYDNVTLNGTVSAVAAAPEPSTLPLVGMGIISGMGTLGVAQRRHKARRVAITKSPVKSPGVFCIF